MRRVSVVITLFFTKLAFLYALFLMPWPGLRDGYATVFRAGGNFLFRTFGTYGRVYFEPLEVTGKGFDAYDTNVKIENLRRKIRGSTSGENTPADGSVPEEYTRVKGSIPGINTRLMGYLPTAFGAALILATPIPWRRRLIALAIGVLVMSGFAALEMWLRLMSTFSNPTEFDLYQLSPGVRVVLQGALAVAISASYVVPVFVWLVVAVRRADLRRILGVTPVGDGGE